MKALGRRAAAYGVTLGEDSTRLLEAYFLKVSAWNARLHLVAPCPPAEFATRHVLESLLAERFLPTGARVIDVGSGAGLPAVPCMIVRPDVEAVLVESSAKKCVFLREALAAVGAGRRARVVPERFERLPPPEADALTCRAIERFAEILPAMLEWAGGVPVLLLFGGEHLGERLAALGQDFDSILAPGSERRHLFVVRRAPPNV